VCKYVMQICLFCALIASLSVVSPALQSPPSGEAKVEVIVERVSRIADNEAHFWLKVVNGTASSVFIEASPEIIGENPLDRQLDGLWLQKWSAEKGWYTVAPCPDLAPSGVLELTPKAAIAQERVLTNPIEAPCKERNIEFKGRFRFSVLYFVRKKDARTNERNYFSSNQPAPRSAESVPFEIPATDK